MVISFEGLMSLRTRIAAPGQGSPDAFRFNLFSRFRAGLRKR
jgi:hypothetical protein